MELLQRLYDAVFHLSPEKINDLAGFLGPWLYVLMFGIIFAETGLVVTPFLPGDSLLFAIGAVAAMAGSPINLWLMGGLLVAAAVLGDAVNYAAGYWIGPKVFRREDSKLLNRKHLEHAQRFYDKHGGKTIILARFMPIVRTFAPFVAGIGRMSYWRFAAYNVVGGAVWIVTFLALGFGFAKNPIVQKQFHYVIFAIVFISILPAAFEIGREYLRARKAKKSGESPLLEVATIGEDPAAQA
jgi:membrane-associated protein